MSGAKPWQLILIVVAMLVLSGSIVYQCQFASDRVEFANSIIVADVITGDLFESGLSDDRPVFLPAEHPTTKTKSMFPAYQKDGKWYLHERYLAAVQGELQKQAAALVDRKTGELKTTSPTPQAAQLY